MFQKCSNTDKSTIVWVVGECVYMNVTKYNINLS